MTETPAITVLKKHMMAAKPPGGATLTEETWKQQQTDPIGKHMLDVFEKAMNEHADNEKIRFMRWFQLNATRYSNATPEFLLSKFKG